jgi:hypothetical protein
MDAYVFKRPSIYPLGAASVGFTGVARPVNIAFVPVNVVPDGIVTTCVLLG